MSSYDTCFRSIEHEGVRIELHWDNDAPCPREWDNLGHIVSFGGEGFGDEEDRRNNAIGYLESLAWTEDGSVYDRLEYWRSGKGEAICQRRAKEQGLNVYTLIDAQCERIIKEALKGYVILGVDSNGTDLWTDIDYYSEWDGLVYVAPETIRKEYSCKNITAKVRNKVEKVLEQEIDTYSKWRRSEFCGFVIRTLNDEDTDDASGKGEVLESCWGFDDEDLCLEEAKRMAVGLLDKYTHERAVSEWNASPMARELNYYV